MLKIILIFLFFSLTASALPVAPLPSQGFEPGLTLRVFKDETKFTPMFEANAIQQTDHRHYRELMLGSYYQINDHWSTGLFYRRAYGLRHNDDWNLQNGVWQWDDTNSRGENFLVLDLTAKYLFEILPGKNWVSEIKVRYFNNYFNNEHTLMLRPGLTYFWLKDDKAFMNFFFQVELDIPQNYNSHKINERWVYAGTLYHMTPQMDVGGFYAIQWQSWDSSSEYIDKNGPSYSVSASTEVLNAIAIFHY